MQSKYLLTNCIIHAKWADLLLKLAGKRKKINILKNSLFSAIDKNVTSDETLKIFTLNERSLSKHATHLVSNCMTLKKILLDSLKLRSKVSTDLINEILNNFSMNHNTEFLITEFQKRCFFLRKSVSSKVMAPLPLKFGQNTFWPGAPLKYFLDHLFCLLYKKRVG